MGKKGEKPSSVKFKKRINADVIILGCTLPGIVTAHRLKKKFGQTMDIVVLDLANKSAQVTSKLNVTFQNVEEEDDEEEELKVKCECDTYATLHLEMLTNEFLIPMPLSLIKPRTIVNDLKRVFEYSSGKIVESTNKNDFSFLSYFEQFELYQYHKKLDYHMKDLFKQKKLSASDKNERDTLLYYDRTCMESHICNNLMFETTRQIMRMTVRLICGVNPESVSLLFYLHQCYRTEGVANHLSGNNVRLREKVIGFCKNRLTHHLQQSVADITVTAKTILEIRSFPNEQVILKTVFGETDYVCNLLAMALKPDQLTGIQLDNDLINSSVIENMRPGKTKKFVIKYKDRFWQRLGYSGDILSVRGPILWAIERPIMSSTGSSEKYGTLMGYLNAPDTMFDCKDRVIDQLVNLFGKDAALPVQYTETDIRDIFIPNQGDFVELMSIISSEPIRQMVWGALDVFADGDICSAVEAGHVTYLHMLTNLRPQAQTYDDISVTEKRHDLSAFSYNDWFSHFNLVTGTRLILYSSLVYCTFVFVRTYALK